MDKLDLDEEGLDLDLLDEDDDLGLPAYVPANQFKIPAAPQSSEPEEEEGDYRKIERNGNFDIAQIPGEGGATWYSVDDGFMTIKEKIGQGAFCQVRRVSIKVKLEKKNAETGETYKEDGEQQLAVKVFNKKLLKNQKTNDYDKKTGLLKMSDQLQTIYEEIKVWQRVNHVNVVKIFELFDDPTIEKMYLMMELAAYGQIQEPLDANGEQFKRNEEIYKIAVEKSKIIWPEQDAGLNEVEMAAKWIFYQVAEGMQFLHNDLSICHRDLKCDNIIMGRLNAGPRSEHERQPTIKVCDFTTATLIDKPTEGEEEPRVYIKAGTLAFNSPEQFTDESYLPFPLDVWAFGITLYVYLVNTLPHKATDELDMEKKIVEMNYPEMLDKDLSASFSPQIVELLKSILKVNPKERISFAEIIKHPWFQGRVEEKFNQEFDFLDM